ncbi:hypothetical protein [uncultured Roseobacter sp.]|uniref:hypothetical protein n=1 Tax=uncultured Roseobacter sp. TaxID=114847 RepID=UPI002636FAB7|nr:hypothetical protein [uncultured Roseobacter sp.]
MIPSKIKYHIIGLLAGCAVFFIAWVFFYSSDDTEFADSDIESFELVSLKQKYRLAKFSAAKALDRNIPAGWAYSISPTMCLAIRNALESLDPNVRKTVNIVLLKPAGKPISGHENQNAEQWRRTMIRIQGSELTAVSNGDALTSHLCQSGFSENSMAVAITDSAQVWKALHDEGADANAIAIPVGLLKD